jgi:hypothetical protein
MAQASIRMGVGSQGASLRTISRELRAMDDAKVTGIFKRRLTEAARPFVPAVRASALAIPVKVDGRHTGLRARIAACAETASWQPGPREVNVAVQIQPKRMPDREKGLPLYMEGVSEGRHDRWRHPVFGRSKDPWVQQPAHPYFFRAAGGFGPAAGEAMRRALDDITSQLNG